MSGVSTLTAELADLADGLADHYRELMAAPVPDPGQDRDVSAWHNARRAALGHLQLLRKLQQAENAGEDEEGAAGWMRAARAALAGGNETGDGEAA